MICKSEDCFSTNDLGSWDRVAVKYDGAYSHNALLEVSIETTLRISIWLRRAKAQALGFPIRGIGLDLRFPESLAEEHHKAWKAMYELSRIRSLEEKTFCCAISIVDFTGSSRVEGLCGHKLHADEGANLGDCVVAKPVHFSICSRDCSLISVWN